MKFVRAIILGEIAIALIGGALVAANFLITKPLPQVPPRGFVSTSTTTTTTELSVSTPIPETYSWCNKSLPKLSTYVEGMARASPFTLHPAPRSLLATLDASTAYDWTLSGGRRETASNGSIFLTCAPSYEQWAAITFIPPMSLCTGEDSIATCNLGEALVLYSGGHWRIVVGISDQGGAKCPSGIPTVVRRFYVCRS